jgi:endonuclease/exonuclease/phosphatase family metal-dependent hydrolase
VERFRVITLNIWNNSGPWTERVELIRHELRRLQPDVIGLQEVLRMQPGDRPSDNPESDQAVQIGDGFGYRVAHGTATDCGNGLLFGNALLSRFPIIEQENFALPGIKTEERRALLYALLETKSGSWPVFVTHLNWRLDHGAVRLKQVRFIVDKILEVVPPDESKLPPILMGDFNAEPNSDEIRFLKGLHTLDERSVYFADAWECGGDGSPGHTFDRRNCFAALAHEPPRRIDYIFVRGRDRQHRGEPLSTELVFSAPAQQDGREVWPSDHFGLLSELSAVADQISA